MKRLIALFLILALALSLAACGKPGSKDKPDGPDNSAAPEYVYQAEFKEIGDFTNALFPFLFTDEGIYLGAYERIGDLPAGQIARAKGEPGVYAYRYYLLSPDGAMQPLSGYTPNTRENTEGYSYFDSTSHIAGCAQRDDGSLLVLEEVSTEQYTGTEQVEQYSMEFWDKYEYFTDYYICRLNADMSPISGVRVDLPERSYLSVPTAMTLDKDGNILATGRIGNEDSGIYAISPEGSLAYTVDIGSSGDQYLYIDNLFSTGDGRVCAVAWGDGESLRLVDLDSRKLTETYPMPRDGWYFYPGDENYDMYYISGSFLYGYDLETGEREQLLNWLDCDINGNGVNGLNIRPDGSIQTLISTWNSNYSSSTNELVTLSKVPSSSVPQKETLRLALMYANSRIINQAIKFNRHSDAYRIQVVDYSQYNTDDDYTAGLTKLNTEIISGNIPDILDLNQLPSGPLAAKGLLEDLYPYLDADKEFSQSDLVQSALKAMETDGHLYQICPSFTLRTVIGAASKVGDTPGWTYEEFYRTLREDMPAGCEPFEFSATKQDILLSCLSMDLDHYVDWVSGQCSFDGQDFINLLEFCNSFLTEFNWENYDWSMYEDETDRITQGKQMLVRATVYDFMSIARNEYYFLGPDSTADNSATYIGYPVSSGAGNAFLMSEAYAMSAKCAHKDAAWEFLRFFLTDEYQNGLYSFPISQKAFDAKLKEAMTPNYQIDSQGNYILDENGEPAKIAKDGFGYKDGRYFDIYELSQAQADKLVALVNSTDKVVEASSFADSGGGSQNPILQIIQTEVQPFFLGQKSAEEVAKLIQSKVNLYVNEQK